MFEKQLEADLKTIFEVKKVSFDEPGSSQEQDCLFLDVDVSDNVVTDKRAYAKVSGTAYMFGTSDKLTFGFFSKQIQKSPTLAKKFFFSDLEGNSKRFQNIVQRGFSFIYFFDVEYDPESGSITSIDITIEEP